jgi:predicted dehydrogenase
MVYQAAVVGLGNIGFKFSYDEKRTGTWSHVDAYNKCPSTNLVGAVEIDQNTIDLFHSRFPEIPVYPTVKALFALHHVDIVSICVPTRLHYPMFKEIIDYNIRAIFCEKPLSVSVHESEQMVALAKERKIVLAVNYTRRWQNSFITAKKMVDDGKIGNLRAITAYYPGQIFNIGSHLFDTVRMISKIQPISFSAVTIEPGVDPSISGWMNCRYGIHFSFIATGKREDLIFEIDIIGDAGRFKILENGEKIEYYQFRESPHYSSYRELIQEEIAVPNKNDRFSDAIFNIANVVSGIDSNVLCSGDDGLAVDRMIDGVITAAKAQEGKHSVGGGIE